jgi:hypothetical protein
MLGEIGRIDDVVFIETTQIAGPLTTTAGQYTALAGTDMGVPGQKYAAPNPFNPDWRGNQLEGGADVGPFTPVLQPAAGSPDVPPYNSVGSDDLVATATPQWGQPWVPSGGVYEAIMLGDNAFGHAISLPVELRDGGVLDFGREHALAWYSIWGWGVVTESSVVKIVTN